MVLAADSAAGFHSVGGIEFDVDGSVGDFCEDFVCEGHERFFNILASHGRSFHIAHKVVLCGEV